MLLRNDSNGYSAISIAYWKYAEEWCRLGYLVGRVQRQVRRLRGPDYTNVIPILVYIGRTGNGCIVVDSYPRRKYARLTYNHAYQAWNITQTLNNSLTIISRNHVPFTRFARKDHHPVRVRPILHARKVLVSHESRVVFMFSMSALPPLVPETKHFRFRVFI